MTYLTRYPGAEFKASPYKSSRNDYAPEALVIHIMDGTLAGCDSWFLDNPSRVSAHLGMNKDGVTHQYVSFDRAAHANGAVESDGFNLKLYRENANVNPNLWAVSLELEGVGPAEPTPAQFEKTAQIGAWLFKEVFFRGGASDVAIDRDHVLKHSDITPLNRRNCPGWSEYTMSRLIERIKVLHNGTAPVVVDPRIVQARDLLDAVVKGL